MARATKPAPTVIPTVAYIVNRAGAVHAVEPDTLSDVLKRAGYRRATEGEIAVYLANPNQTSDNPIGKRGL